MLSKAHERLNRDFPDIDAVTKRIRAVRPLSEMVEHEIANEKLRLLNLPDSEQTEETENRLADILDWEDGR